MVRLEPVVSKVNNISREIYSRCDETLVWWQVRDAAADGAHASALWLGGEPAPAEALVSYDDAGGVAGPAREQVP